MLAENFLKTQQVLYPKDFEVCISVEVDTKTNVMMVNTYIYMMIKIWGYIQVQMQMFYRDMIV